MNFCEDTRALIDAEISKWCEALPSNGLSTSMCYSLRSGGKRFRPVLSLLTAEAFGVSPAQVLGWAMAIELVHTYSLIHDDLPCMDNDDYRRGQPTNHKVHGEHIALLAGDALMTEAFGLVVNKHPEQCGVLVQTLVEACGVRGMVHGQVVDLISKDQKLSFEQTLEMQNEKTGALIRAAIEGAALLCGIPQIKTKALREFGSLLGLAFQLRDDILDSKEKIETGSFPALIGLEKTETLLNETTECARSLLAQMDLNESRLQQILQFNVERSL